MRPRAVHSPSTAEEAGIRQAIFDYVAANALARRPVITRMRVSSITLQAKATGRHRYRKFARVDLNDPRAGYAAALEWLIRSPRQRTRRFGFATSGIGRPPGVSYSFR